VLPRAAEAVRACLEALGRYKLRTALSILGIMLGVAAVVAMVSVTEGARNEALRQVSQLGLDNVFLRYRNPPLDERRTGRTFGLMVADLPRITSATAAVRDVAPLIEQGQTIAGPRGRQNAPVLAVGASYPRIMSLTLSQGRFLTPVDEERSSRVCLIGGALVGELFGHETAIGSLLSVGDTSYQIVGVLRTAGHDSAPVGTVSPRTFDRTVIVPWTALPTAGNGADRWFRLDEIWIRVTPGTDVVAVGQVIERTLALSRPNGPDYEVVVPRELLNQQLRLRRTFNTVLGAVAAVTLLVGGIGVMNVMLTSVLERTSEIGLRRAVGATQRSIAVQFLAEAVLMCAAGGVVGLVIGIATSIAIAIFGGWPTVLSGAAVFAGLVVSISVGLASGVYPARRAASLSPIDAVRYE
jgi:putative ABC transport system permease protein